MTARANFFNRSLVIEDMPGLTSGSPRVAFGRAAGATAVLPYDAGNGTPAIGATITGAVSGATGTVVLVNVVDVGIGYAYLTDVVGTFIDDEAVDFSGGSVKANGSQLAYAEGDGVYSALIWGIGSPDIFAPPGSIYVDRSSARIYTSNGIQSGGYSWLLLAFD